MGRLRKKLNYSGLGESINNSKLGRWFEQTDFALSVEEAYANIRKDDPKKEKDRFERGFMIAVRTLSLPFSVLNNYFAFKIVSCFNKPNYHSERERLCKESVARVCN